MKYRNIIKRLKFGIFLILVFTSSILSAAIILVDRDDDLNVSNDGGCDLRDAINSANTNTAIEGCTAGDPNTMDVIYLNVDRPIQLTSQIDIISSIFIRSGFAFQQVTIKAATNNRIFSVHPSSITDDDFQMLNLRLVNGNAGLENGGAVLFSNFPNYSNNAEAAIISIVNIEFENNQTDESGGAISFIDVDASEITIEQSKFIGNTAKLGGAIHGENLTYQGTFRLEDNVFKSNTTVIGGGGAIFIKDTNTLPYEINNNLFWGNIATSTGGALFLTKLSISMQYNLTGNVFLLNYSGASGGAIYLNQLDLYLTNNTFAFNSAARGGAIYSWSGEIHKIVNSTFLYNEVSSSAVGAHLQIEGLVFDDTLEIGNSIFANPTEGGSNCLFSLPITLSKGSNISDDTSCDLNHISDVIADPELSGLVYHNSGLPGFIPTAESPALDTSLTLDCLDINGNIITLDQQGNSRTTDGDGDGTAYCDSGAIEAPANADLIWADSLGG